MFFCFIIIQELEELSLTDTSQQLGLLSTEFQQLTTKIDATKERMEGYCSACACFENGSQHTVQCTYRIFPSRGRV